MMQTTSSLNRRLVRALGLAALASLAACATTEKYERSLEPLRGLSEAELVQRLGKPARSFDSAGFRYLVYERRGTATMAGYAGAYEKVGRGASIGSIAVGGTPDMTVDVRCETTFELQAARVVAWSLKGNYCKSAD